MRTRIRALLAATVLAGAGGLVANAPATATHDTEPPPPVAAIDVTSSIDSVPGTVSPPGTKVLFPVKLHNSGLAPITGGKVTVTFVDGFDVVFSGETSTTKSSPSCTGDDDVVICHWDKPLLPGESAAFEVVAHTPLAQLGGVYETKAVASTTNEFEELEHRTNNHSEAFTTVLPSSGEYRAGLVEGGHSLELAVEDGRRFKLKVPIAIPGVIVEKLAPASGAGKFCGVSALPNCGDGFILVFEAHPTYKAEDPSIPLLTDRTFEKVPCNGLGAHDKCHTGIFFAENEDETNLAEMQTCNPSGQAIPAPCINLRYKSGGKIWFQVLMLTNDPLELPPSLL